MADLTSDQLRDLQADLAILSDQQVFTDAELNRLYARASEDYDGAMYLAIRQLWFASLAENDYTAGQTSEKRSQISLGLERAMNDQWAKISHSNQVALVGLRSSPRTDRDLPAGHEHPDIKNTRFNRAYWWRDPFRGAW